MRVEIQNLTNSDLKIGPWKDAGDFLIRDRGGLAVSVKASWDTLEALRSLLYELESNLPLFSWVSFPDSVDERDFMLEEAGVLARRLHMGQVETEERQTTLF